MASQLNPASTRRFALKDISLNAVNKASPQGAGGLGPKTGNPEKPPKLVEASRLGKSGEGAIHDPVHGEARLGGQKRVLELVQTHNGPDAKRFKDGHTIARGAAAGDRVADLEEGVDDHEHLVRDVRAEDAVVSPLTREDREVLSARIYTKFRNSFIFRLMLKIHIHLVYRKPLPYHVVRVF